MKRSFLIFILPLLLWVQNDANAQQNKAAVVLYASKDDSKTPVAESNTSLIATIPFEGAYYENYYGSETFDVYAGEAAHLSLVYLKVTTFSVVPLTVEVFKDGGEAMSKFTGIRHPLVIGYGYKPGIYFIHICQGKKEMVLRFCKGV